LSRRGSLPREAGRPADAGQRVDQGVAPDAEGPADRRLARATLEGRDHRRELLGADRGRTPAASAASARGGEASPDPLLGEGALELRLRAEDV
jgi:hypothetical protein